MVILEGLAGGRWALVSKTHHCMVDGVGSVDVASVLLDPAPDAAPVVAAPLPAVVPESPAPSLPRGAQTIAQALHVGATVAQAGLYAALHPQEALERSRSLADVIIRDELIPASASSINVPIGSTRRFAVVTVPFAEVSAIRGALGGSVNDVVLAACTTGLRRLLIGRDEPLPDRGLRAMVPINLRDASERLALGNRISSLFVGLPVAGEDGRGRYDSIVAETTRLKASGAGVGASTIIDIAGLAPPVLHATLARSLYSTRLFNITITNVPGSPQPLYSLGARMRAVYPLVPIAADHTLGIAVFSYDGALTFGVTADADSTPDLSELTSGIRAGIAELLALASRRASASGRSRRAGERAPV
jgi:WS/DGAT/MGAT family acyltransferase